MTNKREMKTFNTKSKTSLMTSPLLISEQNVVFLKNNGTKELLKLCENGDIFVNGKLVENDKEVVDGLREFLKGQQTFNNLEIKQTALVFLLSELDIDKLISRENLTIAAEVVRQAKEMEKQQIIDAYKFGLSDEYVIGSQQYYNETFGGKDEQ
jgi:hypothetical protein